MKALLLFKGMIFLLLAVAIVGCGNRMFQPKFQVTAKNVGEVTVVDSGAKFYGFYHSWGILPVMCSGEPKICVGKTFSDYQGPYPKEATVWWTLDGKKRIERTIKVPEEIPQQFGTLELVFEIDGEDVQVKWVKH